MQLGYRQFAQTFGLLLNIHRVSVRTLAGRFSGEIDVQIKKYELPFTITLPAYFRIFNDLEFAID